MVAIISDKHPLLTYDGLGSEFDQAVSNMVSILKELIIKLESVQKK